MRTTFAFALAALLSWTPAARAQKIASAVMAVNAKQQQAAGQLDAAIGESLARSRDLYRWRDLVAAKAASVPAEALLRQKTLETLAAVKSGDHDHAPLAELEAAMKSAAPTAAVADEQAAEVALAAVAWAQGDAVLAEQRITDALSFEPMLRPVAVADPVGWGDAWKRAQFSVQDRARGELSVASDPAGARVLIDGAYKGTTPLVAQGLLQGPHLVQIDLFGCVLQGEIIRVSGAEVEFNARLSQGDLFTATDQKQAVLAATLNDNGKPAAAIGQELGVEYLVLGWLAPKGHSDTLSLAAVRVRDGKVLASQALPLEGDEYGQAGLRAASVVGSLLEGRTTHAKGEVEKKNKPRDPLNGRDGTEDW